MTIPSISKPTLGAIGLLAVVCAFFGYGIVSAGSESESLALQLIKLQKTAKDERRMESATNNSGLKPEMVRAQVMNQFTNHVASAAGSAGVKLSQLQFDPTPTKIVSKTETPATGKKPGAWALNNVSFAIDGPTPQVYLAIRKIAEMSEPFQLTEVAINRVINQATGIQGVTATIKVALLVPSEGS